MSAKLPTSSDLRWLLDHRAMPSSAELSDFAETLCDELDPPATLPLGSLIDELPNAAAVTEAWHTFTERLALLVPFLDGHSSQGAAKLLEFSQSVNYAFLKHLNECSQVREETNTENLKVRVGHLTTIQRVNNAANSTLDLEQVLDLTVRAVTDVLQLDDCSIYLFDEGMSRLTLRATTGLNPRVVGRIHFDLGEGITGRAAQYGKPVALEDAGEDPRYAQFPELVENPMRSLLSVPINLYTVNRLVGVLDIQTRLPRKFSQEEIGFVETVCGQVAIAIDNARLYGETDEKLREKVSQLTTLQRVSASIGSSLDLDQVLDMIVRHAAELSNADKAAIFKFDEIAQEIFVVARYNISEDYKTFRIAAREGAIGQSILDRNPVHFEDVQNDPALIPVQPQLKAEGIRSMFWVPLIARDRVLGGICVFSVEGRKFSEEQIQLGSMFAYDAALAIENARLYQESQKALESQAVLMREMQHRVKNNLQTVASLLSLQMRRAESPEAAGLLGLSAARVESIAAVHELFSEEDIGLATVGEIANRIMEIVLKDLVPPSQDIEFSIEPAPIELGSKQATLFALVLNELVSNAIMHGLEGHPVGSIRVTASHGDGIVAVDVWNSGSGMPEDFSLQIHAGLGLSIVEQLVTNELSGTFLIANEPQGGATARITFPAKRDDFWTVWWKD